MNIVEYAKMRKMFGGGSGGDLDALINGSLTEITSNAESVRVNAFYNNPWLTKMNLPKATTINSGAFNSCSALTSLSLPLVKNIPVNGVRSCKKLTNIEIPNVTYIADYAFQDDASLETVDLPLLSSMGSGVFQGCGLKRVVFPKFSNYWTPSCFNSCKKLTLADFGLVSYTNTRAFSRCYSLKAVILRSESRMTSMTNVNTFEECYHFDGTVDATYNPDGLKDGYIYVPRALIDSYKVATNWVTFADRFRALEDYTVDGTTTGELDESKVSL